jgi:hypothetical protein
MFRSSENVFTGTGGKMSPTLTPDLILTALLCVALVASGIVAIWLLPWSAAEQEGTVRAFGQVGRMAGEVLGRSRAPFLQKLAGAPATR